MIEDMLEFWAMSPEDPFDVLFEHAPVMMHSIDQDGLIMKVSDFWADSLGYTPQEMIGRRSTEFLTEASREAAETVHLPKFMRDGKLRDVQYEFVKKNGEILPVVMSAVGQFDKDQNFQRSLAVFIDNSGRKLTQNLYEASQAKSRFIAAMSHEIRTPMNAVLGFAQLLKRSNLDHKQSAQLDAIIAASTNLMQLLGDVLDLSRLEAGRMQIVQQPFNLHSMIDEVMDLFHSNAFEKGLRLRCILDRDVPTWVSNDVGRIRQVLNNFLSNAIKFTEAGTVTLLVEEMSRSEGRTVVKFSVTDTGPGIDEKTIERLFVPFVQVDTGQKSNKSGWGLGLSICHHIASLLSGTLRCEPNSQGPGTTFSFEVPLNTVADPVSSRAPDRDPYQLSSTAGQGLRVLVAEDNIMNQDVMESMLVELGHSVKVVSNGFEAISSVQDNEFDLVLMDVSMPGLDGVGATQQIRNFSGQQQKIPIIAVTGNTSTGAREHYRALGMNEYIAKPVSLEDLGRAIFRVTSRAD